jgi:hypothetical protein
MSQNEIEELVSTCLRHPWLYWLDTKRRIRAQQREEAEAARLQEIEKQKERDKRAAFKAKAASFEQRGPSAEDVKASVQKEAASRKFNRLLTKQLASPDSKNPLSTEMNLKNQINNKTPYDYDPNLASNKPSGKSDWEFVDQGSAGPSYYWNRVTNETTFDRPSVLDNQSDVPPPPPPPPPPRRQLPGMDSSKPPSAPTPQETNPTGPTNTADSDDPTNWELVTNQPGGDYYWNIATNECTYEMPPCIAQLMAAYSEAVTEESGAEPAVAKWEAKWDDAYQAFYYLNLESGESTWEKPADLA